MNHFVRALVGAAMVVSWASGCYELVAGDCEDTIKSEVVSLEGAYVARAVERNCGATTNYSTLIFLSTTSPSFEAKSEDTIVSMSGKQAVGLTWNGDARLTIAVPDVETFTKKTSWRNDSDRH